MQHVANLQASLRNAQAKYSAPTEEDELVEDAVVAVGVLEVIHCRPEYNFNKNSHNISQIHGPEPDLLMGSQKRCPGILLYMQNGHSVSETGVKELASLCRNKSNDFWTFCHAFSKVESLPCKKQE